MELIHKINQLENVMSSVAQHLNDPNLLQDHKEKEENQKFGAKADLKENVMKQMEMLSKDKLND